MATIPEKEIKEVRNYWVNVLSPRLGKVLQLIEHDNFHPKLDDDLGCLEDVMVGLVVLHLRFAQKGE